MKIVFKQDFIKLMNEYPDGGIVFAEYEIREEVLVTNGKVNDGKIGTTAVVPFNGEVFSFDWNIDGYSDNDEFIIFDNEDILQMIATLTKGVKTNLKAWNEI